MKKLLFLLAGALVAFTASAQNRDQAAETHAQLPNKVETKWEGLCPDYGDPDGYLYAIFVKVEVTNHLEITAVDPVLRPARQRYGEWEAAPGVLLDYKVWLEPGDGGIVHYEVTYQYPGWPVRTVSSSFSYI